MGAMANTATAVYIGWEEVVVSTEKGRREVHYYLKRRGGGADLVMVGKEKNRRHMSYRYVKDNKFCFSNINRTSMLKLSSRKEVVDWLNSILSALDDHPNCSQRQVERDLGNQYDTDIMKDVRVNKFGQCKTEFMWLGSPWTCRKRRRHYQSFCRNGVTVSIHDFIYVLAEENKRLVAYLDDVYEDSRGNKMAVVQWFHKIHEVGFVLPHDYNDREIFFSLCFQDLNIECIDGLTTVLSPEHYKKFAEKATEMGLAPYLCIKQFDNDDVKPFDITRLKGYWKQAILKSASNLPCGSLDAKQKAKRSVDADGCRPRKKVRWSKENDVCLTSPDKRLATGTGNTFDSKGGTRIRNLKEVCSSPSLFQGDDATVGTHTDCLTVGSHVEVLSQDSGLRGCWFRTLIIKKHKDKIEVQYQDIKDADNEAKNLEEWVLASQASAPDVLGIRVSGRTTVRPSRLPSEGRISSLLNVGSVVDAWWHDGWWEGLIVKKEEDKLHVYFPGEKQVVIFSPADLRHSQEWVKNGWQNFKDWPELATKLCDTKTQLSDNAGISSNRKKTCLMDNENIPKKEVRLGVPMIDADEKIPSEGIVVRDLSKDDTLVQLKWKSSGKRRRGRSSIHKIHYTDSNNNDCSGMFSFHKLFVNSALKFDADNCKYKSDYSSSVPPLTSLVMSR